MKKKDKLDKTIEELQEKWQPVADKPEDGDVIVDIIEPLPMVDKMVAKTAMNNYGDGPSWSIVPKNVPEQIEQVGVRDTYLPFVLTKLKICGSNTEARKKIFDGKIKIDNKVVQQNQYHITKSLSNFLLEVDGRKWEVFKID